MKVLVTGAAGFIGYHVCKKLLVEGFNVVGLDNINDYYDTALKLARLEQLGIYPQNTIQKSNIHPLFKFYKLGLEEKAQIFELFKQEKFDYVINLAAQPGVRYSIENPDAYIRSNIIGFHNILEACRAYPVVHLLYASSSSVYGMNAKMPFSTNDPVDHPVSLYASTKRSNELEAHVYSHLYNIPTTGLRFFTVYGPWGRPDMAPMLFAKAILAGEEIKVFNEGKMERDFTYVDDIVEGIYKVMSKVPTKGEGMRNAPGESDVPFRVYNIGCSQPVNLMDFIGLLEENLNKKAKKKYMPMQPGDVISTYADVKKLKELTGYNPSTPLEVGIKAFVKWYVSVYKEEIG